jgi:hypothetical protein
VLGDYSPINSHVGLVGVLRLEAGNAEGNWMHDGVRVVAFVDLTNAP